MLIKPYLILVLCQEHSYTTQQLTSVDTSHQPEFPVSFALFLSSGPLWCLLSNQSDFLLDVKSSEISTDNSKDFFAHSAEKDKKQNKTLLYRAMEKSKISTMCQMVKDTLKKPFRKHQEIRQLSFPSSNFLLSVSDILLRLLWSNKQLQSS